MANLEITILGCGPSSGVPLVGYATPFWGDCCPSDPRNRRTRASIYVRLKGRGLLVDAGPDVRQHLLSQNMTDLEAVLITHAHADHFHGLDEFRPVYYARGKEPIPLWSDSQTLDTIEKTFPYLFRSQGHKGSAQYPKIFTRQVLPRQWTWQGLKCQRFDQHHGFSLSQGLRMGPVAYSTDFVSLDDEVVEKLQGLDVWIVDCLGLKESRTHCHLEKTLGYIERVKPKKAILTHMNHELDYETLCTMVPSNVVPAYDGMQFHVAINT